LRYARWFIRYNLRQLRDLAIIIGRPVTIDVRIQYVSTKPGAPTMQPDRTAELALLLEAH
jgi:hypothetical protein